MAEQQQAGAGQAQGGATGAEASGQAAGTQAAVGANGTAEAGKGAGSEQVDWKAKYEAADADARKARDERDKAKADRKAAQDSFLATEEGKTLAAKAAEADALRTKLGGQANGAQQQGAQQVDVGKIVDEKVSAALAERDKAAKRERVRSDLVTVYQHPSFGGVDSETFLMHADKLVDEVLDGRKSVGQVLETIAERKPFLFGTGKAALAEAKKLAAAGPDGHTALHAKRAAETQERGGAQMSSLTEYLTGSQYDHTKHYRHQQAKPGQQK